MSNKEELGDKVTALPPEQRKHSSLSQAKALASISPSMGSICLCGLGKRGRTTPTGVRVQSLGLELVEQLFMALAPGLWQRLEPLAGAARLALSVCW